jgi:hypothetical protein
MSESPVVWWYRVVNCEVDEMCVETGPVLGAESGSAGNRTRTSRSVARNSDH